MKTAQEIVEKIAREKEAARQRDIQRAISAIDDTAEKMYHLSQKKFRIYNITTYFESSLQQVEVKKHLEQNGFTVEKEDFLFYLVVKE